jgi:hypothetical protein
MPQETMDQSSDPVNINSAKPAGNARSHQIAVTHETCTTQLLQVGQNYKNGPESDTLRKGSAGYKNFWFYHFSRILAPETVESSYLITHNLVRPWRIHS